MEFCINIGKTDKEILHSHHMVSPNNTHTHTQNIVTHSQYYNNEYSRTCMVSKLQGCLQTVILRSTKAFAFHFSLLVFFLHFIIRFLPFLVRHACTIRLIKFLNQILFSAICLYTFHYLYTHFTSFLFEFFPLSYIPKWLALIQYRGSIYAKLSKMFVSKNRCCQIENHQTHVHTLNVYYSFLFHWFYFSVISAIFGTFARFIPMKCV